MAETGEADTGEKPGLTGSLRRELREQVLRTRQVLAGNEDEAAEAVLAALRGRADVEQRIAADMAAEVPLADPDGLLPAHRRALKALEVLELEGGRDPHLPHLGPIADFLEFPIENVAGYLVSNYAKDIADRLHALYGRRLVQCDPGTRERALLARTRREVELVTESYGGGGALIRVLAASAAVPLLGSVAQAAGVLDLGDTRIWLVILPVLGVLFALLAFVLLYGAATAHRRSRLIMAEPLAQLWVTIGHCGEPPEDDGPGFAVAVIVINAVIWLLIPGVTALVLSLFF